jgi:hypothetical protein
MLYARSLTGDYSSQPCRHCSLPQVILLENSPHTNKCLLNDAANLKLHASGLMRPIEELEQM